MLCGLRHGLLLHPDAGTHFACCVPQLLRTCCSHLLRSATAAHLLLPSFLTTAYALGGCAPYSSTLFLLMRLHVTRRQCPSPLPPGWSHPLSSWLTRWLHPSCHAPLSACSLTACARRPCGSRPPASPPAGSATACALGASSWTWGYRCAVPGLNALNHALNALNHPLPCSAQPPRPPFRLPITRPPPPQSRASWCSPGHPRKRRSGRCRSWLA